MTGCYNRRRMRAVIDVLTVPPFDENTYLVGDLDAGVGLVVDPGGRTEDVLEQAARRGLRVAAIAGTHTHIDHVAGAVELRQATGARFLIHAQAEPMLMALGWQASMFGLDPIAIPPVDGWLSEGECLEVGDLVLTIRHTPGHAPGHVTLVSPVIDYEGGLRRVALVGDLIFLGSIGRTDLPGGDYETLMTSIERQILSLPEDTVLLGGHGPATTVGHERRFNPFVVDWLRTGR